jgi:hypothetical protein
MAHFISFIQGCRGEASRLGSKDSGIRASARGWHCGMRISGRHQSQLNRDVFTCYADHGSSGSGDDVWLAQTINGPDGWEIYANPDLTKIIPHDEFIKLRDELISIIKGDKTNGEAAEDILLHLNYKEEEGPND